MRKCFLAFALTVNVASGGTGGRHDTTVGDCWQLDWSWRETGLVRTAMDNPRLTAWDANGDSCAGKFSAAILSFANLEMRVHLDTEKMPPTASAQKGAILIR